MLQMTENFNQAWVASVTARLSSLESAVAPGRGPAASFGAASERALVEAARAILLKRRMRDRFFGDDLFGEPAFDLLLDLYVSRADGRPVSVSSACIAAGVPPTTALRHLATLDRRGLTKRVRDPSDARRQFVELSPRGLDQVDAYLRACTQG